MTALTLPGISIRLIQDMVAHRCNVPVETMRSPTRQRQYAWPRQLAMMLAREFTDKSLQNIGNHFGGRNHATVWASSRVVERRAAVDRATAEHLEFLRAALVPEEELSSPFSPTCAKEVP